MDLWAVCDRNAGRSTASVALSSQNHVVVIAKLLANLGPSIKVVLRSDGTTDALLRAHRPVLLESRRAVDGGLVGAGGLVDIVCSAVRLNGALLAGAGAGVVGSVGLDNVVFNERVACPAVQRNVRVDVGGVPGARVVDDLSTSGIPSFACNEVANVAPLDGVFATVLVVVAHGALAISPEGVEEAVVSACAWLGVTARENLVFAGLLLFEPLFVEFEGRGEDGCGAGKRKGKS